MQPHHSHVRPRAGADSRVRAAAVAVTLLLVLAAVLGASALAAGCGGAATAAPGAPSPSTGQELTATREAFTAAAAALLARDRAAFVDAVPAGAGGAAAAADLAAVYDALAPLPWSSFAFRVEPMDPAGLYRVTGYGRLGDAAPADRLAVDRVFDVRTLAGGIAVTGDETPPQLRRRYLMALDDPVAVRRPGFIVLADGRARFRASEVVAAAASARPRLAAFGLATGDPVVITVFGSADAVRDSTGVDAPSTRLIYFAYAPDRLDGTDTGVLDVGVMGPWLHGSGVSTKALAHELAHAASVRWFDGLGRRPALLVEGIAEAVEGIPAPGLREEVATGDQLWPLPESFAVTDLWKGNDGEAVSLGYQVGGSLAGYVVSRWGAAKLRAFARAVAAAPQTAAGFDAAVRSSLGIGWERFYAGWRAFVLRGSS